MVNLLHLIVCAAVICGAFARNMDIKRSRSALPGKMLPSFSQLESISGLYADVAKRGTGEIVNTANIYHPTEATTEQSVEDMCIFAHNYLRTLHGVDGLTWNATLAAEAAEFAKHLAEIDQLDHSQGSYGENLYYGMGSFPTTPANAVYSWYRESWHPQGSSVDVDYDYSFNPTDGTAFYNAGIGHFTQVVWKSSTQVGCGMAKIKSGDWVKTYVVARYLEAGNMLSQFTSNVLPLTSGAASLNGKLKVSNLIKGPTECKDVFPSDNCQNYAKWNSCTYFVDTCNCEC